MSAAIEVIGLISGVLGIYDFVEGMLASKADGDVSTFRVWAGLDGTKLTNAEGGIQTLRLYNGNGALIGSGGGDQVSTGDYTDLTVAQSVGNQALTTEFYADDDAICIAIISATLHDGSRWGWTGDWGKICGLDWFYSGVAVQNSELRPMCTWVDRDHSNGFKAAVIGITWDGFIQKGDGPPSGDGKDRCGSKMRAWDADGGKPVIGAAARTRRNQRKSSKFAGDDRLVVSSIASHNATELCQHENSFGPDFVSLVEGVYCDMGSKRTLPLCGAGIIRECFDLEAARLARKAPGGVASANAKFAQKTKGKLIEW